MGGGVEVSNKFLVFSIKISMPFQFYDTVTKRNVDGDMDDDGVND